MGEGGVRAKFTCTHKSDDGREIQFCPVYSGSEENKKFFEATPGGDIVMFTVNPEASQYFEIGKEYYVDFSRA